MLTEDVVPAGRVRYSFDDDLPHIRLAGEIDSTAEAQFDAAYAGVLSRVPAHVVVDLADVTFFSCAGLAFVARLNLHLARTGHRAWLVSPGRATARVLALTGFAWDTELPAPAPPGIG